jgi:putative transposase
MAKLSFYGGLLIALGMSWMFFFKNVVIKKAAIRFLSCLLGQYQAPRVIITDKLRSYVKPIKHMMKQAEHRSHKRLNNRIENAHQPTRRKEKCLTKFKSPPGVQRTLSLMGSQKYF